MNKPVVFPCAVDLVVLEPRHNRWGLIEWHPVDQAQPYRTTVASVAEAHRLADEYADACRHWCPTGCGTFTLPDAA